MTPQEQPLPEWERDLLERQAERDTLYRERAQLVAFLAACWPSTIVHGAGPSAPDWPVIFIRTPAGQMSWHLSPSDLSLFTHVKSAPASDPATPEWDGRTTAQKYERLTDLTRRVATGVFGPLPVADVDR